MATWWLSQEPNLSKLGERAASRASPAFPGNAVRFGEKCKTQLRGDEIGDANHKIASPCAANAISAYLSTMGTAMSMYYSHTLIPDQADYIPHSHQVEDFYSHLIDLGAAPRQAELILWTEKEPPRRAGLRTSMRERRGRNPFSGEAIRLVDYMTRIDSVSIIGPALEHLQEYKLEMRGIGPLRPLFQFDATMFNGDLLRFDEHCPDDQSYECNLSCSLKPDIVSMSDDHMAEFTGGKTPEGETVVPLGEICSAANRTGFFSNPKNNELIRVPGAGCARFWIEFGFGKWLFPDIKESSLDLLPANVVNAAQQIFGVRYLQGCHWG